MKKTKDTQLIKCAGIHEKSIMETITQMVVTVYVFSMLVIFPLFYQNKYYDMGVAKYNFFKYANIIVLPCVVLVALISLIIAMKSSSFYEMVKGLSITDWFVLAYLLVVFISYMLSPYKSQALWGAEGWYMGLISQVVFVAIYFTVSRFYEVKKSHMYILGIVSGIVFLLGILNRFYIDPLNMYDGRTTGDLSFLSTLGQPTWYSSFLCTVFPIGLYLFWNSNERKESIIWGIYCFIGFSTMITQNSDSAFIGFGLMMLGLFCFSFSSNKRLIRFAEVCVIALTAFKFMGLLQIMFPDHVFKNDTLSRFGTQSTATLALWLVMIIVLILLIYLDKKQMLHTERFRKVPLIVCIIVAVLFIAMVILIYCVTTGSIPESMSALKENNYLNFNNDWGNARGINWKYAVKIIGDTGVLGRLFGGGPDTYQSMLYTRYMVEMNQYWGSNIVCNAHNEWLNVLVTMGLFGFVSYVGIFISKIVACVKNAAKEPFLIAVVLCVLGYMGHNVFCYQQIICTPMIFIIMAAGQYILREMKKTF